MVGGPVAAERARASVREGFDMDQLVTPAPTGTDLGLGADELERQLEHHRTELTGYCYRMLGSASEAEDAVQEALVRAWRAYDRFEGRSALRSWLYRIASNVCFDMLRGRQRRARPMEMGPAQSSSSPLGAALTDEHWVMPAPDARVVPSSGDPADVVVARETIRLAFVAAVQHLPPRQRAALLLHEVVRLRADEIASLLGTSVASVNSALQRARATLAARQVSVADEPRALDEREEALLAGYLDAFERYDMDALTTLLHDDATLSMPPYALWMQGPAEISGWMLGSGKECRGSRLVPTRANGSPAFGQYRSAGPGRGHAAWALQVLEVRGGRIAGINAFLDTATLFPLFGLPLTLDP
jgi:RNA polymerase sigma-70 factor (ECF subfamily)